MTDFTHKYRQAVDSLEYSPDFKERTAAMMKALRDRTAGDIPTADSSVRAADISVETVSASALRRRNIKRIMSVMGAAAACFALCVTAVKTGVLDGDTDIAMVTETAAAEGTDVIPQEALIEEDMTGGSVLEESVSKETAADMNGAVLQHNDNTAAETSAETADYADTYREEPSAAEDIDSDREEPAEEAKVSPQTAPTVTAAVTAPMTAPVQTAPAVTAPSASVNVTAPVPSPANISQDAETGGSLPVGNAEYVPPVGGNSYEEDVIADDVTDGELTIEKPVTGGEVEEIAEPAAPITEAPAEAAPAPSPDFGGDNDYDGVTEEEAVYEADIQPDALDDPAYSYSGAVGYDFSAYDEAKKFDRKDAYAVITPLADDYDEQSGRYISHDPGEVRGTVKMRRLISAAALYAEDGSWEYVSSPPAEARYIIDFADESGNSLRAYAGEGFICYAFTPTGGEAAGQLKYYYFTLSEEESGSLEELLAGNVK